MKKTLIWVGALTLLAGVGLYAYNRVELSYKLAYEYKNIRTPVISRDKIVVEFDLVVNNKGELKETISKIDIDVFTNDVYATRIISTNDLVIEPNSKTTTRLQMILNPAMLYQNIGLIAGEGLNDMRLRFKGFVTIRKFGIPLPIPFIYNTTYREFMQG